MSRIERFEYAVLVSKGYCDCLCAYLKREWVHIEVKKHSNDEGKIVMKKRYEEVYLILLADRYYPLEDKVRGLLEESVRERETE